MSPRLADKSCRNFRLHKRDGSGSREDTYDLTERNNPMLWTIIVILFVLWLLGVTVVHVGSLIHLLLVIALVVLIIQLISGRRAL